MSRGARGDGGLSWNEDRQLWIAAVTIGYDGRGKRVVRRAAGRTKTEALTKMRSILRDLNDGLPVSSDGFTVAQAVEDWLTFGLVNRDAATQSACGHLARTHVIPHLGARKLRDLSAPEVNVWLSKLSETLSTRTLQGACGQS